MGIVTFLECKQQLGTKINHAHKIVFVAEKGQLIKNRRFFFESEVFEAGFSYFDDWWQ